MLHESEKDGRQYLYKNGYANFNYGHNNYATFTDEPKKITISKSPYVGAGAGVVLCSSSKITIPSDAENLVIEMEFPVIPVPYTVSWYLCEKYSASYDVSAGTIYKAGSFAREIKMSDDMSSVIAGTGIMKLTMPLDEVSVQSAYLRMYAYGTVSGNLNMNIRKIYFE